MKIKFKLNVVNTLIFTLLTSFLSCNHEIGSKGWCKQMINKPGGDWTPKESLVYARKCTWLKP